MEHVSVNKKIKRIDKWMAYVVNHAYVKTIVYIVALLEATISPLVPEIVVAAVLTYRKDISWKLLSLVSALGSITGVTILYFFGKYLYKTHELFFENLLEGARFAQYTQEILSQNAFVAMFLASFTPLPDRVFAFLSGVLSLPFIIVIIAFFCGRLLRVGIVAYFSYKLGDEARSYILKHTRTVSIVLTVLIVVYIFLKVKGII
jgi:membrane protein YqaA with SNARE-associated domain